MSTDSYQREVQGCYQEITRLQKRKSQEAAKVAEESKKAADATSAASRSSSASIKQSKLRDAQKHSEASASYQKSVADLESKIAREQQKLADAERRLADARLQADRRQAKEKERASQEYERRLREQDQISKNHEHQMASIAGKIDHHEELHRVAMNAIEKLNRLPEGITVLFFASNPDGGKPLKLDEEVRSVVEMIRKSEHRDSVRLESRWAVRPGDVLQAINELNPSVIHFSGHGTDQDQIVFQDNLGRPKLVSIEAIVATIAATSDDVQLVFFNTCYSHRQAEAVVQHVPAAIGMNTSIGDEAARIFSSSFYSAIGFGRSVGHAFRQAKAALMLEGFNEEKTPELFMTPTLNADRLILVKK